MDLIEAITKRRSVRKFKDKAISENIIQEIRNDLIINDDDTLWTLPQPVNKVKQLYLNNIH
jgi:hypothetical protein